jgi:putative flippase GtrA
VKTLTRWGKFNLVGAMGMVLQLGVLALLNRWTGGHYLYASAAALEITLLHNFAWHVRFTWRDRGSDASRLKQLARFHVCNGAVSLLGNLALMELLVPHGLPVLASNAIAIVCCSLANFWLGSRWVFARNLPYTEI